MNVLLNEPQLLSSNCKRFRRILPACNKDSDFKEFGKIFEEPADKHELNNSNSKLDVNLKESGKSKQKIFVRKDIFKDYVSVPKCSQFPKLRKPTLNKEVNFVHDEDECQRLAKIERVPKRTDVRVVYDCSEKVNLNKLPVRVVADLLKTSVAKPKNIVKEVLQKQEIIDNKKGPKHNLNKFPARLVTDLPQISILHPKHIVKELLCEQEMVVDKNITDLPPTKKLKTVWDTESESNLEKTERSIEEFKGVSNTEPESNMNKKNENSLKPNAKRKRKRRRKCYMTKRKPVKKISKVSEVEEKPISKQEKKEGKSRNLLKEIFSQLENSKQKRKFKKS